MSFHPIFPIKALHISWLIVPSLPSKQSPIPARLNSSGTSSHSRWRTLWDGTIKYQFGSVMFRSDLARVRLDVCWTLRSDGARLRLEDKTRLAGRCSCLRRQSSFSSSRSSCCWRLYWRKRMFCKDQLLRISYAMKMNAISKSIFFYLICWADGVRTSYWTTRNHLKSRLILIRSHVWWK